MFLIPITINDEKYDVKPGISILEACRNAGVDVPTLCSFKELIPIGACRLCLVEIEGIPKLLPACTTPVAANQVIRTESEKLSNYRKMMVELLFSERNHICSVCVANNQCELQNMGYRVGMERVRFHNLAQPCALDATHKKFVVDHNRCILCARCVRVCHEVEGAHTWDVKGRGYKSRVTADFNQPWGEATTCTWCNKCVHACPTGALWNNNTAQGTLQKFPAYISELVEKRKQR